MAIRQSMDEFPKRGKIAIIIVSIVFSLSIYAFIALEGLSVIDSLYFLVITVSTVGFGDIEYAHQFTKIMVMLLIVTGISTLAILSETAIDRIVLMRAGGNFDLPQNSLDLKNHIVFTQFNDIVERMAQFAQDRLMQVVIIDRDPDMVKQARKKGFLAYLGEAENPQTLELLTLQHASALYLFLDDDNHVIQSAILAENLAPDLLIYANTAEHLSIDYGKIVGITRTYHNERLLGSFITTTVKPFDSIVLPNQEVDNSIFRLALIKNTIKNRELLENGICIGIIDSNFMDIIMFSKDYNLSDYSENLRVLVVYTKYDDLSSIGTSTIDRPIVYNKILIAGWSKNIKHLVEHLEIDHSKIQYFTFNKDDYEIAKANGYDILFCSKENVIHTINENISDNDLIINVFPQITDSLLLDVMVRRSDRNPQILQVVSHEQELEVFQKIGVNKVISPDILTSRAMFQILLTDLKLKQSAIFRGYHLFEHTVKSDGPFHRKSISNIEKQGYKLIILHKHKSNKSIFLPEINSTEHGDRLLLFKNHTLFSK